MRLRTFAFLFCLTPALLPAQDKIVPYPGTNYADVKQYVGLTDAQLQSLQAIVDSYNRAQQDIYTQIGVKNQMLYDLLNAGSVDAPRLGQLLIDIQDLQKRVAPSDGPYKTQARALLTETQKPKVTALAQAMQLQNAAYQAGSLLLIDFPQYNILPASGVLTSGTTAPVGMPMLQVQPAVAPTRQ